MHGVPAPEGPFVRGPSIFAGRCRCPGYVTATSRKTLDRARDPAKWVRRATRTQALAAIAYRLRSGETWHRGVIVNISRTGLLFVADAAASPAPRSELVIYLTRPPVAASAQRPPWPQGYGRAVVTRTRTLLNGELVAAARFDAEWTAAPPDGD